MRCSDGIEIASDIWDRKPGLAAALAGFCDGKLGRPPNPPKAARGGHISAYMGEHAAGAAQRPKDPQ